ncbi:mandelate racemase/muconate lactonizing enzyme family protein [Pelagibacterium halotolerans]|uniref:Putative mandelate racemase n=1 Tax=Pelagibacterium halotolerans (strain DSM 22347 / JCM 15775 / CGMCC 1.7692 / B2) TaxID=1082931 RepID=G4RFL4_PELHB|nr:mandelate racemase/muconate lactonizing enzyme family protein [Pelagibacterium halotolerans]AEQ53016.1 putative mandelate racemase [Pelagibacterium halotolerans B2]QJR17326.1 mandelate racemase/muconate lactonizing enzyme family protein [Pelagibacterium halotolerans]SEA86159.1 L-alanine-DL-glutamate epimerase [Pelagibacterium halotolerans]
MIVTDLRTTPLVLPLDRPIGNATATITKFSCIAIHLETDEGLVGENLIFTIRPEQHKMLDQMVHVLADAVIGKSPDMVTAFWQDAWQRINFIGFVGVSIMGISAIDGALWDLRGKAANRSIAQLLGQARTRVPAYASGGLWLNQDIDEIARQAADFVAAGFGAVKLRLAGNAAIDVPRVAAVREAIGPQAGLMIDANQALDAKAAIALARQLEPFAIAWFEEPVPAHDLAHSAQVARALDIPIASGENEYTIHGFRRMLEAGAADIVMPDLQRVGGVSEFMRVGALAAAFDTPVSSHLFPQQSLSLMAAIPNATLLEHLDWFTPLYSEPMEFENGHALMPDRPGWGFSFDPAALAHYAA